MNAVYFVNRIVLYFYILSLFQTKGLNLNARKQIVKTIVALMLLSAFMLPVTMQFFHVFEGHGHEVCKIQDTHLHQDNPDCAVCHFHFAPFQYNVTAYSHAIDPAVLMQYEGYFSPQTFSSPLQTNTRLRAPPQVLG